ncbi:ubiquitinyl hydrolase [Athelia psychrophila]|uniref:Ubiquitin carboxyl-terminal hydrolase n=1 Tax=Athelia psychrophila TaxID=1759441 RepID=A0A166UP68_9AGAM|nr:ubiquitinyl hydrolase [Fibularhizoctonia sp. CBS 109695]KZP31888.1 ubiquitinyl hydrolase [Fibularhizoctonia sp. CBS 109695]
MSTPACHHLSDLANLRAPRLSQSVHREECTQCFDNQDGEKGIDVCMSCFNGSCLGDERHHARDHHQKSGHPFALNVRRKLKPSTRRAADEEPPAKMTKLAIVEDREEDKYEHVTALRCYKCAPNGVPLPDQTQSAEMQALVGGVLHSMSSARQSEVKAWEEEIAPCEHTLTVQQLASAQRVEAKGAHCAKCELGENLWLCLTCGALGCGRQQFGGIGGNGHGLNHYEETGHAASVKLGTITPEGNADIYCYVCNDSKVDPDLALHLSTFGINVQTQQKTEKSMTELQIEHNLRFDFSLTDSDGKAFEPVFGPGLTGLANLGNSCYMASVLQTLFALPAFQNRYLPTAATHWSACTAPLPAACVDCQMHKLADGLLSGRYSHPASHVPQHPSASTLLHDSPTPTPAFQAGVRPVGFKALIGKGHAEFATMRQQDAEEFLSHLLTVLRRSVHARGGAQEREPTEVFAFGMEQRLQCGECGGVRYRVDGMDVVSVPVRAEETGRDADGKVRFGEVALGACLDTLCGAEALEYACPKCEKSVIATKQTKFATFPEVLVVHARKFQLVNWVPTKLDVPVILPPSDQLTLDSYLSHGLRPTETALPSGSGAESASGLPQFNEAAMSQLEAMGFPAVRCQRALLATGNSDAEAAMEWLFGHMEDADIDEPIPVPAGGGAAAGPEPSADQIAMLADMGFTPAQAGKALRETGGDAERAVEWLFSHPDDMGEEAAPAASSEAAPPKVAGSSALPATYKLKAFISHKGPSVHSGHYVAHIRVGGDWVLFNDEKVVKAAEASVQELKKLAYLYVFEKA